MKTETLKSGRKLQTGVHSNGMLYACILASGVLRSAVTCLSAAQIERWIIEHQEQKVN